MKIDENYIEKLVNTVAKTILESFENLTIEEVNMYRLGYKKAIDDFVKGLKEYMENKEQSAYIDELNKGNDTYSAMPIYDYVDDLAEQLKR